MPRKFRTRIGNRDLDLLTALDRTPLTADQLCRLSEAFETPFADPHNLRRRLRLLAKDGLIRSWPYAIVSSGRSPNYYKLTRDGYRLLYGVDVALPRRTVFEEISHGHHRHTLALAEVIVQLLVTGFRQGIALCHFARENSVRLSAGGFTQYPDCVFQLQTRDGNRYNFVVELDNGTERVRSTQDVESIERKLRGYDVHQAQFAADDPDRYLVIFVTTRSQDRLQRIMSLALGVMQNPQRTVFVAAGLKALLAEDPFRVPLFVDHRGLRRTIVPAPRSAGKSKSLSMTQARGA